MDIIQLVSDTYHLNKNNVQNVLTLLEEGNTVPFIARYRKEVSGNMNEEQIREISELYDYQTNLLKRKEDVKRLIDTVGKLTKELSEQIDNCTKLKEIEDLYRPYQQKRKTRASIAIALGLEPLADYLLQVKDNNDPNLEANKYLKEEVPTIEEALQKAQDIIAERVSNDLNIRNYIRDEIYKNGMIETKIKKGAIDENKTYVNYYDYSEKVYTIMPHRIMAISRGEKEKILSYTITFNTTKVEKVIISQFTKNRTNLSATLVTNAITDGLNRLCYPSLINERQSELFERASKQSIDIFSINLEKLLLQPPVKNQMILGVDPAFRTGCKITVVDENGKVMMVDKIYPTAPKNDYNGSK
ncbi:MAG: Tex-like N-terminal domain-containing protein, partial [Erysipelotrichaceae bacterium]